MKDKPKRGQSARKSDRQRPISTNGRRAPSARDCRIYERYVLEGETQERLAAEFGVSRQRVAKIVAKVEGWIAGHPDHPLARSMRVRVARRYESLWNETMAGFERSRARAIAPFWVVCHTWATAIRRRAEDQFGM